MDGFSGRLAAVVVALGLTLSACSEGATRVEVESGAIDEASDDTQADLSGQVIWADFGGPTNEMRQNAYFDSFYDETGVEVLSVSLEPAIRQKMLGGGEGDYDIVQVTAADAYLYLDSILAIPTGAQGDLIPEDLRSKVAGGFYIGFAQGWLTETFPDGGPQNWADFFDVEKFPGKRAWPGSPNSFDASFEIALLADGVPADELYPLDIDRAIKKLDTIRDHLTFYQSYPEVQQLLSSGSVAIGVTVTGQFNHLQRAGLDVTIQWNEAFLSFNPFVVPEQANNPEAAMALATWMRDPQRQAEFVKGTLYGPANSDVFDLLPEDVMEDVVNAPDHVDTMVEFNDRSRAEIVPEMTDAYTAWLAG